MTLKFNEFIFESTKDTTHLRQVINVLSKSKFPLTYEEICDEINSVGEIQIPRSSYRSVLTQIIGYTKGKQDTKSAKTRNKSGKVFFELVSERPQTFKLSEDFDMGNIENIQSNQKSKYYLLGSYSKDNPDWWKQCVEEGKWYNGFALGGDSRLDDKVNEIPVGANVSIKSTYTKERTKPAMMVKARGVVTKNHGDGTQLDVEWEPDFTPFELVRNDVGGYRSTLHEVNNQGHIDLIWGKEDDFSDLENIKPFGKFPQPFDVESELKRAQAQSEDDVFSFKKFRAIEPNESPDELMVFNSYVKNPFSQAICVLGESGAGKSTTLDNILQKSGHAYQYIIPSASTTGLLSQFSPSAGAAGGYIPSRLGQMIEKAYNNKDVNYTAVFDECHKTSIIEMINDELLQAISKNRNKGVRFISLDDDTRRLYQSAQEDIRGNVLIPDNFGFIFISSNARVISGNPDFFNRVDLIELTTEDRKLQSIEDLNQKRVTSTIDKKELVNKIVSGGE